MNKIDWSKFTGETFQLFCSTLLSFEISKRYVPFTAPGRDTGIDGSFDGEYNGYNGKWRFQFKFHKPDTGRSVSISLLKSSLKNEIEKASTGDDNLVLLTNVEVNPNQRNEIETIAGEALKGRSIHFELWDGSKLETLAAKFPLIHLWYGNNLKFLVQDYREFFADQLKPDLNTSFSLSNSFYYRDTDINKLNSYIFQDSHKLCIITGDAGIGKTRLCLEFFQRNIDSNDDWIALTFTTHQINFEVLSKALGGNKNYVILVDDAHKYKASDISDLLQITNTVTTNKIKIVLTTRSYFEKEITEEIKDTKLDSICLIPLKPFSKQETNDLLSKELTGYNITQHLNYFTELTFGKPIVIVSLLRAIKSGIPIIEIKKDTFLNDYLRIYLKQVAKKINSEYQVNKKDFDTIVEILSLIEPVQIEDVATIDLISKNETIDASSIRSVFNELKTIDFIAGYYEFSIKPDIYSDIILSNKINKAGWLPDKLSKYSPHINKIIKNLNSLELKSGDNNSFQIDKLLHDYIDTIDSISSYFDLQKILDTVYFITYPKSGIALETIEKFIDIYSDSKHPLYNTLNASLKTKNYSLDSGLTTVKNIIRNLAEIEDYTIASFILSSKLYEILKDDSIVNNISGFDIKDYYSHFNMKRQHKLLNWCMEIVKSNNPLLFEFSTKCIDNLLKLEYTVFHSDYLKPNAVIIKTFYVPETQQVKELRLECIKNLSTLYKISKDNSIQENVLVVLLGTVPDIISARKHKYKGADEISNVLNIMQEISKKNIPISQKQSIKDKTYWFRKWGIDKKFESKLAKIESNLTRQDLTEELLDLFNPRYDKKYEEQIEWQSNQFDEIIKNNSVEDVSKSLIVINNESKHQPYNLYFFLNRISLNKDSSINYLNFLWDNDRNFTLTYCHGILRRLFFEHQQKDYFRKIVDQVLKENTAQAYNFILISYDSFYVFDKIIRPKANLILDQKDVETISLILHKVNIREHYSLTQAIPILFLVNKKRAVTEIKFFLEECTEKQFDDLLFRLTTILDDFYKEITDLIFANTIHLGPPFHLESILNRIAKQEGFKRIFNYFTRRYSYRQDEVLKTKSLLGYRAVPTHSNHNFLKDIEEKDVDKLFFKILEWFIKQKFELFESLYGKDFLGFFCKNPFVTETVKKEYLKLIKKYKTKNHELLRLTRSLAIFENKNNLLIDIIIEILNVAFESGKKDFQKKVEQESYISITSTGIKSGTYGEPFAVDLMMRDLFSSYLETLNTQNPKIKLFLENVLKGVQSDIEQSKEKGGEIW